MNFDIFETTLQSLKSAGQNVGTSKNNTVEKNYRFYHVVQRAFRRLNILGGNTAWYYHTLTEANATKYDVLMICQMIMPNHIHEIFFTNDVSNISKLKAVAGRQASTMMNRNRAADNKRPIDHLFDSRPGFVPIQDRQQLLVTMKYIRDNDDFIRAKGDKAPYSCFDYWEKGEFKNYGIASVADLYGLTPARLMNLLNKEKEEVLRFATTFSTKENSEADRKLFLKQTSSLPS